MHCDTSDEEGNYMHLDLSDEVGIIWTRMTEPLVHCSTSGEEGIIQI